MEIQISVNPLVVSWNSAKTALLKESKMSSITLTNAHLLTATSQTDPFLFPEGFVVHFPEVFLPVSIESSSLDIIKELGKVFQQYKGCLFPIPPDAIQVESVTPLSFRILKTFKLHSVVRDNWIAPPFNRIAFRNIAVIHNLEKIPRGNEAVRPLLSSETRPLPEQLEKVPYLSHDKIARTFEEMLIKTHTDGILILREGQTVYEKYFNGQASDVPHIQFSVTKSLIGIIVAELIQEGIINPEKCIGEYIPELINSGFGDARVIEVLDMTTELKYLEEYTNPDAEVVRHMVAATYLNPPTGYKQEETLRQFLPSIKKGGKHDQAFHYVSANTEVLSWLVENATQLAGNKKTVKELFAELIWTKLGAEQDAFIIKDKVGDTTWAGGFTATTRDMARIGQMILNKGKVGDKQLISPKTFEFICARDRRPHFAASGLEKTDPAKKGWSYINQFWWTHNKNGAFSAQGIHGQNIYIDPEAKIIIAKNSSHTEAEGEWLEYDFFVAAEAITDYLIKEGMKSKL